MMHICLAMYLLLPFLVLLFPTFSSSSQSPSPSKDAINDYGRIIPYTPSTIVHPKTSQDISRLIASISSSPDQNKTTVAARGAAHSIYGQANAPGGIILDMLSLPTSIQVVKAATTDNTSYVDAGGGALWVDVLNQSLMYGLTPRSWTDYLYLTVGGTLSVGGISGQSFKYGPQIANVLELDVITGKGEEHTCSAEENSDLFYGVLGGLGQFGIITRARIKLQPAPRRAKRVSIPYDNFNMFTRHQELLILKGDVDYLEGFLMLEDGGENNSLSNGMPNHRLITNTHIGPKRSEAQYSLELALYYEDEETARKKLDYIVLILRIERSTVNVTDMSYFDFLNRVRVEEENLRKQGLWDVSHPWINFFVPRVQIGRFKDLLLGTISANASGGPIIIYPTLMQKWDSKMSAVLPYDASGSGIMYVASILRAAPLSCTIGTPCLDALLNQNEKIINIATAEPDVSLTAQGNTKTGPPLHPKQSLCSSVEKEVRGGEGGIGAKQYLPYWHNEKEWIAHFGEKWERFRELKSRFDPFNILAPGQRIFQRKAIVN